MRIEGLTADLRDLERRYDAPMSAERRLRLRTRLQREQTELWRLDFATLATEARVDWHLLDSHVARRLAQLEQEEQRDQEVAELLPFAPTITALHEARRQLRAGEPEREAAQVAELADRAEAMRIAVLQGRYRTTLPSVIGRAGLRLSALRQSLQQWFAFRDGYDPEFGWWLRAPHQAADQALGKLGEALQAAGGAGRPVADRRSDRAKRRCAPSSASNGCRTRRRSWSRSPSGSWCGANRSRRRPPRRWAAATGGRRSNGSSSATGHRASSRS